MTTVRRSVEVGRPISTVYNQWTRFESFPEFMQGVERVHQIDDRRIHWKAEIGMAEREWDAEITEQTPDQVIAWRATGDVRNDGRVTFEPVGSSRTRVSLTLEYDPQGLVEQAGDKANLVDKRVEGDLERFKRFVEERGVETGGWRGDIH